MDSSDTDRDVTVIDDPTDRRVADYVGMRDPDLRRATEERDGIFLAEGVNVLRRLLTSSYRTRSVVLSPTQHDRLGSEIPSGIPVYVAGRDVLAAIAGFDLHRGVVASAERGPVLTLAQLVDRVTSPTLRDRGEPRVSEWGGPLVALEGLTDHENLGAIARSGRALGARGLLLDGRCADPLYRRAVRVSMGEMLHLPWARVASLPTAIAELQSAGWAVAALTPASDAIDIAAWSAPPERTVLVFGSEGPGLSSATADAATARVRIPIDASVDSLNVGHAAAVALALIRHR